MPRLAAIPERRAFPVTTGQARAAAKVTFTPADKTDKLTKYTVEMVEGNQWLNGVAWIGPWSGGGDFESDTVRRETRRAFVPKNVLAESTGRHASGVLGREPQLDFVRRVPTDAEDDPEYRALITSVTNWWDRKKPHLQMQEALDKALYCERGVLMIGVHLGKLAQLAGRPAEDGTVEIPEIKTLDDALDLIDVTAVHPKHAAVRESPRDGTPVGVRYYTAEDADGQLTWPRVQWVFLLPNRDTILVDEDAEQAETLGDLRRRVRRVGAGDPPPATATTFALGGRITLFQFVVKPLIKPEQLQQQAAINFYNSALPRVISDAGWMARIFFNVQPPGKWQYDKDGRPIPGSFTPSPLYMGPRTTNFMQGIPLDVEDANGVRQSIATPSLETIPPVDPEFAIKALRSGVVTFLEGVSQAHVFLQQQGEASGRAHEMARADYEGTLDKSATAVNPVGRELLEGVVALAEDLLDTPGRWTSVFRAVFKCRLSLGRQTADEAAADTQAVQADRLSVDTAMERGGIDDVAAERARMDADPNVQRRRLKEQAEIMETFVGADLDRVTAAELAGLPKAMVQKIEQRMQEEQAQQEKLNEPAPADPPAAAQ